ncbi:hypothetical protein R1flu_026506 [Riccia fluitans]|uniref:F-box domain-containing protein n=1 Tax=Riccia fluitans TaxID=41844 RepID=A0ABD1XK72_9MARC
MTERALLERQYDVHLIDDQLTKYLAPLLASLKSKSWTRTQKFRVDEPENKALRARRHRVVELPFAVVEKIFSALPFPELFKVRQVSKEWKSKCDEIFGPLRYKWPTLSPISFNSNKLIGFHAPTEKWHSLNVETLGFQRNYVSSAALNGVLLCTIHGRGLNVMVSSIWTRERKSLSVPPPLRPDPYKFYRPMFVHVGKENYKLVLVASEFPDAEEYTYPHRAVSYDSEDFEDEDDRAYSLDIYVYDSSGRRSSSRDGRI